MQGIADLGALLIALRRRQAPIILSLVYGGTAHPSKLRGG